MARQITLQYSKFQRDNYWFLLPFVSIDIVYRNNGTFNIQSLKINLIK